ncbi:YMGG-like glycine zipper-containing protein [Emticicia sp. TH156]|uniref:YMGG-like glycine zipper-containing protein n=1 Tax=Emticicia sp. TH156 TaxID=2067454 RepID=UPI000C76F6DD|nr:YMGG-like glycine zipper-containing protein [Emticicia sp. TH156]PLK43884.1 glycine zipper family protein [Emticicia sp. TH156]
MKNVLLGISLVWFTMSCNNKANTEKEIQAARQAAIDSVNQVVELERVKQATIDSMNVVKEEEERKLESQKATRAKSGSSYTYASNGSSGSSADYVPVSQTSHKKRMSNAAKGALIGAGVGALTGVAIAKDKKGKGALIGAGVGAGAGAITGVIVDKQQQKKQQQ